MTQQIPLREQESTSFQVQARLPATHAEAVRDVNASDTAPLTGKVGQAQTRHTMSDIPKTLFCPIAGTRKAKADGEEKNLFDEEWAV